VGCLAGWLFAQPASQPGSQARKPRLSASHAQPPIPAS
jgi:hypothetical protein